MTSATHPEPQENPATEAPRLQSLLARLAAFGHELFGRIVQATQANPEAATAEAKTAPAIARGIKWAITLHALLAGTYRLPPHHPKPATPETDDTAAELPEPLATHTPTIRIQRRPITEAALDRIDQARMHIAFATRPLGWVIARICRDLTLTPAAALFPTPFVTLTQTPAAYAAQLHPPQPRKPLFPHRPFIPVPPRPSPHPTPPDPRRAPRQRAP